jgi:hypothetical protein
MLAFGLEDHSLCACARLCSLTAVSSAAWEGEACHQWQLGKRALSNRDLP